jgi:hypothetical protein
VGDTTEKHSCRIAGRNTQDWREKRDWQGRDSHVTRVSLLALVARHSVTSRRIVMNSPAKPELGVSDFHMPSMHRILRQR